MSIKKHPDYKNEEDRLSYTIGYLNKIIHATEDYKKSFKENIKEAYVDLDYLDSSQSYINIIMNTNFLQVAMKNYDSYRKALKKPYFARIDIQSNASTQKEEIYIGKTSLFREEDQKALIIDWRSPLASVYYDGRLGEVTYESPTGEQEVDLLLKRQFSIENGELIGFMDIDITANDAFLQASLGATADDKLKDIASTIQAEQNKVIRAEMKRPLIVQGVAGSGKTTIALHRIAYFIYTYEDIFSPDNFMIIAPNKLFLNYISDVLPELGVEDVRQTTFIDLMKTLIGTNFKLESNYKNIKLLLQNRGEDNALLKWYLEWKGSMKYKEMIDRFVEEVEKHFVPRIDFALQEHVLMSAEAIEQMFTKELRDLPIYKRLAEIEKNLKYQLKQAKKNILLSTEKMYDSKIDYIRTHEAPSEERRLKLVKLMDQRDVKLKSLKKDASTLAKNYTKAYNKKKLLDYFKELYSNEEKLQVYSDGALSEEQVNYLYKVMNESIKSNRFDLEDFTALAYLKACLYGFDHELNTKVVVIDEAQDYSLFQLYTLKKILKTNRFTLLGDLSQGIYGYRSLNDWEDVVKRVFPKVETNYKTLVQSYRTTVEIMNLANEIIKGMDQQLDLAQPVLRHGPLPTYNTFNETEEIIEHINEAAFFFEKEHFSSIAIICKTMEECVFVQEQLNEKGLQNTTLLKEEQETYGAGIVIVPSYLAKGLEFDAVIIGVINDFYSKNSLDIKLLYVAMTRALHRLMIYSKTKGIEPLEEVEEIFYKN